MATAKANSMTFIEEYTDGEGEQRRCTAFHERLMENVEKLSLDGFDSVMLGVLFIFMSLLCRCGAEAEFH